MLEMKIGEIESPLTLSLPHITNHLYANPFRFVVFNHFGSFAQCARAFVGRDAMPTVSSVLA
jgi:hypothetical protein